MRSIWSGALSFGLINIPVKLYAATSSSNLDFDWLRKEDLSPVGYVRVAKKDKKEVSYNDLVKGFEIEKGKYVVLDKSDFEKANVRKTKTIEIQEFVNENQIDSIFYEKPYYIEPEQSAAKPYNLLLDALKETGKVAVVKFVLRNREHLGVIKPERNVMILDQMRFGKEIRSPQELNIPQKAEVTQREKDLAVNLVNQLSGDFKPNQFKDTYREELERVIQKKAEGKEIKAVGKEPEIPSFDELSEMLQKSLEKTKV